MKQLWSPEGELALSSLAGSHALFAFDFDGTLAPIVRQPDRARVAAGVFSRLAKLARLAPVAVISGRRLSDLRSRIPADVQLSVGNHGSERVETDSHLDPMRETCRQWLEQLQPRVDAYDGDGVFIEDKGITLSVHFRMARERERAERTIADWIRDLEPAPRVIGGKFVFNLLPEQARTKFEAVAGIAADESAETVLFVGDDLTDESVFEQAPPEWITVRVERDPDSRARFFIEDQSDVANLLDRLIGMRTGDTAGRQYGRTDRGSPRS